MLVVSDKHYYPLPGSLDKKVGGLIRHNDEAFLSAEILNVEDPLMSYFEENDIDLDIEALIEIDQAA